MNKIIRYSVLAIGLAFLVSGVSVREGRAQADVLPEILKRLDTNNKSLQSLQSDVTMVKFESVLNVSDTYLGSTSYLPKIGKRARYARIDWKTENGRPNESSISLIGDQYELYKPKLNQVIVGQVGKSKNNASVGNALAFMDMSRTQLEATYETAFLGVEQISGGIQTWHVLLTPKVEASYKTAEIWVDKDGMPRQAKITERNNDATTVLLSNIQKNVTIKGDIFKLAYDRKKVTIIKA
jgi:outer membrane lipoprotein-sorting protein